MKRKRTKLTNCFMQSLFSTVSINPVNLKQDTIDIISWDNSI